MIISDEMMGLDIAHRREIRNTVQQAQAVVDGQDRRIIALQRALATAREQLATANATIAALKAERGARNNALALAALRRRQQH